MSEPVLVCFVAIQLHATHQNQVKPPMFVAESVVNPVFLMRLML